MSGPENPERYEPWGAPGPDPNQTVRRRLGLRQPQTRWQRIRQELGEALADFGCDLRWGLRFALGLGLFSVIWRLVERIA